MRLDKLLPARVLTYEFQFPVQFPPVVIPRSPLSIQGVDELNGIPNGATIAAGGAGAPDALRGTLDIYFPWVVLTQASGINLLRMNIYKTGDTVDPLFAVSVPNAQAGRTSIAVAPGATIGDVALAIQGAINTWLAMLNLATLYNIKGGRLTFKDPLTHEILEIVAPKTAQTSSIAGATDAMAGMLLVEVIQPAVIRPILNAGFHPGPWRVVGDAFDGFGTPRRED